MGGLIVPFTAGLFVSAGISFAIAVYIQRWQDTPGIRALTYQLVFQTVWALGFALETIAPDLATKLFFRKLAWVGIMLVPVFWGFFILRYTRNDRWLNQHVVLWVALPIVLVLLAAFTNEFHRLFWSSAVLAPGVGTGIRYGRGPIFWIAVGLEYALVITAMVEMIWVSLHSPRLYLRQALLLVFASGIPLVTSLLFVLNITQPNDWTPVGFALTGLIVSWVVSRYHFFNLLPVARGQLFEIVPDGLLAFDSHERVVDANPALLSIIGFDGRLPAGEPLETLFGGEPGLLAQVRRMNWGEEAVARDRSGQKSLAISMTSLSNGSIAAQGRLVVFRDVTAREDMEHRLRLSEKSLRRLFEANPIPLVMIGMDYATIYSFNQAFMDFFKILEAEMPDWSAEVLFGSAETRQLLLEELAQKGNLRSKVVAIQRGAHGRRTVLLTADGVEFLGEDRILISLVDISERMRLEQAEHEQHVFSEVLREASLSINSSLELDQVLDRILENLSRVVGYDAASILLVNDAGIASIARTRGFTERGMESPFGKVWLPVETTSNLQWMVQNRRAKVFRDVSADAEWIPVSGQEWARGHLDAPLITARGVAGFLGLDSTEANFYSEADAERLMIYANQAGVAIDNACLYARIRKSAQESEVLQQITLAVGSSLDFNEIIQRIFELVNRLVPSDSAGIQMVEGDEMVLKAMRGFSDSNAILGTRWSLAGTSNEQVLLARKPIIFADVQANFEGYRVAPHNQTRSVLMIPLIAGGEVIGFLSLDSMVLAHFSEDDLRLANLFAGDVAAGLENARLYEEARRRSAELEILNRVGTAITSGLDLGHVLVMLFDQCRQVMPADSFYVALYQEEKGEIEFPLFHDQGIYRQVPPLVLNLRRGMAGCVIEEGHTIYLRDTLDPHIPEKYRLIRYGGIPTRSYLGVPMFLRDKVIGVISTQSTLPNAYSSDQVRLLEIISSQAVIAIENARLYQQAQTAATTDDLTSLLNRRELFRRAEQELARAKRYRHHLAMVMIDFDHFKRVNDTYGHLAGDQVLRSMARICQENMRLVDVVGRYGGEEILVLMPETTVEQAVPAVERLRSQIEKTVVRMDDAEISVTISAGVAGLRQDAGMTLEGLIAQADLALFMAKSSGRNRICLSED
jgi:diguanylate cyclase (GGDEF)-like protein